MTYYEWVKYIKSLQNGALSDDKVEELNKYKNEGYSNDINIRFINQLIDLINYRLNTSLEKFLEKIPKIKLDAKNLAFEISNIKNEISQVRKLTNINIFDENTRKSLLEKIHQSGEDMNKAIKSGFVNETNSELIMLINDLDVNN